MNTPTMKGDGEILSGILKERFADLSDDDVPFREGKEDEVLRRLQKKLGMSK